MKPRSFLSRLSTPALLVGVAFLAQVARAQTITEDPQSRTNIPGTMASFTVTATGVGTLAYQWQFNGTNLTDSGSILGATTTNLTISNVQSNHTGFYAAAVTDSSGSVTSRPAFLLVFLPPAGGTVDATFAPSGSLSWINTPMRTILPQPDGKVLIGGEFTYLAGVTYRHLMRLEESGAVDPSFAPTLNGLVGCMAFQDDGRLLIGGGFSSVNGTAINHLARLNPNGTLDASFQAGLVQASGIPDGALAGLAVQPDGKVIIGGTFNSVHGITRHNVARLDPNGALDATFQDGMPGTVGSVGPIVVQPDGKVLIGGGFTRVNGVARNGIARLNADGSLDLTFLRGLPGTESGATVFCLALQPDGKVVMGGTFTSVNGSSKSGIARLNPDGTLDTTFPGRANGWVHALAVQSDGRILLGGQFSSANGTARSLLARLNPNGTLDSTFVAPVTGNIYPRVGAIAAESDWKVFIGGTFTNVNGVARDCLARLWSGTPSQVPLITRQPEGGDLTSGADVAFSVAAIGDPPLTYRWRKDGSALIDGGPVSGALSPALRISALQPPDAGDYTVVVGNAWGNTTSAPIARLTVDAAPLILAQPESQSAPRGSNATFTIAVKGAGPFEFQWFKHGAPLADGGRCSGAQTSALTLSNVVASDAGQYAVKVRNAFGTTNSAPAALYVAPCRFVGNIPSSRGWAQRVVVAGHLAYLATVKDTGRTTFGGLDIIDVSDPTNLVRRGSFNTLSDVNGLAVAGNRAYLARGWAEPMGLTILDISNPAAPSSLGHFGGFSISGHGQDVAVSGTWAYLAAGTALQVIDVSNPASPRRVGWWASSYGVSDVAVAGNFAYVAGSGLNVIDVSNPTNCVRIGGDASSPSGSVAVAGPIAYAGGGVGLRVYDVSNPSNVVLRTAVNAGGVGDIALAGDLACGAGGAEGLKFFSLSNPINPVPLGSIATRDLAQGVAIAGDYVYVADGAAGLTVFSMGQGVSPMLLGQPQDQIVDAGSGMGLFVTADSIEPLRYQWFLGNTPVTGATNSVLWLSEAQLADAGHYHVVVSNESGSVTSGVAVLTVTVPPRLEIAWSEGSPILELTGTVGAAYAVESAPALPWTNAWVGLTNVTLASNPWAFTDFDATVAPQRYYRARQLDFALDSLAGKTILATVTNAGPFSVTLTYDVATFTQTSGGEVQSGSYTYVKTGPVTGQIRDETTAPPEVAGNTSTAQLTFTSPSAGVFVSNSFTPGDPVEIAIGTFLISD